MSRKQSVSMILTGSGLMALLTGLFLCFLYPARLIGPGLLAIALGIGAFMVKSFLNYRIFSKEDQEKTGNFTREVLISYGTTLQFCLGFFLSLHFDLLGPIFVLVCVSGIFGTVYEVIRCFE